jgi:ribosome-associated protein
MSLPPAWESEVRFVATRAQGPGGQNVNKVSNAVQLRFDIGASSLPSPTKARMLALSDQRLSKHGVLVIKAQSSRSLEENKASAMERLRELIVQASLPETPRRPTQPTYGSKMRRLEGKAARAQVKSLRSRPQE